MALIPKWSAVILACESWKIAPNCDNDTPLLIHIGIIESSLVIRFPADGIIFSKRQAEIEARYLTTRARPALIRFILPNLNPRENYRAGFAVL